VCVCVCLCVCACVCVFVCVGSLQFALSRHEADSIEFRAGLFWAKHATGTWQAALFIPTI
jgi:hypothetical protein